jgi:hypothetical protein
MTRKQIHRNILGRLLSLKRDRYVAQVRLVARLNKPKLLGGSSVQPIFVFIPDLHLMSKAFRGGYKYHFRKLEPKKSIKREVLLDKFCNEMLEFRKNDLPDPRMLKVVQLGDLVDLWREGPEGKKVKVIPTVKRILKDNPEAVRYLVRRSADSLQADLVRGNHDWDMSESEQLKRAKAAHVYTVDGKKTVLVTHGHVFDWIEDFPDEFKEFMVKKFGRKAKPGKAELDLRVL